MRHKDPIELFDETIKALDALCQAETWQLDRVGNLANDSMTGQEISTYASERREDIAGEMLFGITQSRRSEGSDEAVAAWVAQYGGFINHNLARARTYAALLEEVRNPPILPLFRRSDHDWSQGPYESCW
jgi:hypothetical protein